MTWFKRERDVDWISKESYAYDNEKILEAMTKILIQREDRQKNRKSKNMKSTIESMYEELGVSPQVYAFGQEVEASLSERFASIDRTAEYNQLKVIRAMQRNRVCAECFGSSSGYGYNDLGRDTLEEVYASAFHTEAALVRPQITCGTHALALALSSNLRPGDELLSISGKPYDTLEEVNRNPALRRLSGRVSNHL